MLYTASSNRPCGSLATCKAAASTHSSPSICVRVVQHPVPGLEASSSACHQTGQRVLGKVVSTGPHGSRVQLQDGKLGFMPRKLNPLHLKRSTHTYAPSSYKSNQAGERCWPEVGLVREFQVEKNEQASPLLSASHVDYAVMYKRAQQVAELCAECSLVVAARVTRTHSHGLHASCPGVGDGFIPVGLLPKELRNLFVEQRAHELLGRELPVTVAEVLPDQHRIRFNCIAGVAAQRAALQPADLVVGVVTEVCRSYAWVAMRGLDYGGSRAMLHRKDFSVRQDFCSLEDVLCVGESITAMLLRCEQAGKRINLSTAHLEVAAGDMLRGRQAVYATAAQQAQLVRAQMQQAQARQKAAAAAAAAAATAAAEAEARAQQQAQQEAELRQQQQLARRIKQVQGQDGRARVLIADSLYQLALASRGCLPARLLARADWHAESAVEVTARAAAAGGGGGGGGGAPLVSHQGQEQEQEQEWWCSGPLAWKAADEREQWQAECQAGAAAVAAAAAAGANDCEGTAKDGVAGGQFGSEERRDAEQQWLQPPAPDWEQALW
ncbi:hypothetical protein COO60DRAFT_1701906 [Scenedesmus sp. NREL 46B-D3]|nr:hypothetical protein COO60DRAFT_1701906 [Scenedesmus sp. NREL 46B-D3]